MIILSLIVVQWSSQGFSAGSGYTPVAVLLLLLIIGVTVIIWRQPQNPIPLYFKVSDLMCSNCPPGVNTLHGLNIQGVRGTAKSTDPTGPCSACPPTGEHLCEHLLDDADNFWDLGHIWHLECDW